MNHSIAKLLLASLFIAHIRADTYCNSCSLPRVLGGASANTIIKAIDTDPNESILLGGISYDESMIGELTDSSSFKPFIGYLSACEY